MGSAEGEGRVPDDDGALKAAPVDAAGDGGAEDTGAAESTGEAPDKPAAEGGAGSGRKGRKEAKKQRPFWKEFPILIVVALGLALVIKTFAVQAFYIPSGSMENTLHIGDRVLVNKIVYHTRAIHRGDIVVFKVPDSWDPEVPYQEPSNPIARVFHSIGSFFGVTSGETDYIKRVVGIPGDHVYSKGNGAPVVVNGHPLSESSYLYPGNQPSDQAFDVTVPPGRMWVMGDHRIASADSRVHIQDPGGGTVPENLVIGRAFVVVWPPSDWQILSIPGTFEQQGLASALLPAAPIALGFAFAGPAVYLRRRRR